MGDVGTSGDLGGTSDAALGWSPRSRRELIVAMALVASAITLFAIVGALTTLSDRPGIEVWKAWTWAITSGVSAFAVVWIPWLALRRTSPRRQAWPRAVAIHVFAGLAYAILHVAGFVLMRNGVYALMGDHYGYGPLTDEFPYELRKDLLTYACNVGLFWLAGQQQAMRSAPAVATSFDIRDGARIIRTPLNDILAASSAGNYVEFWLSDGRRPLMRATLAAVEVELERAGFLRVHRSWLINARRVTGLRPDGSGDWTVEMGAVQAPLSRRYPLALERLKG